MDNIMIISITIISLAFIWLLYETYLLSVRLPMGKGMEITLEQFFPILLATMAIVVIISKGFGKLKRKHAKPRPPNYWFKWWHQVKLNWST